LVASALAEEEMNEEKRTKRKLLVHKVMVDLEAVRNAIEKDKTRFFTKLGFLKPKHEEIECESVLLFYEPFLIAKTNYFLDYYENKTYRTKVGDNAAEVVVFGQTLKPKVMTQRVKGVLKRSHKEIVFDAQERVIHKVLEVTEHTVVYTPIYEARCRHLKTGEIKIIPISGVTGKMLSL
jgi:hypothetical protein